MAGPACIPEYRGRIAMQLLWRGIAAYVFMHRIDLMFGCASLPGIDPDALAVELTYLYDNHLAPPAMRPRALAASLHRDAADGPDNRWTRRRALAGLPPLIKGYLRLGGFVGDGAVIDTAVQHHRRRRGGKDRPGDGEISTVITSASNAIPRTHDAASDLPAMTQFNVIMTAPVLAPPAVAVLEAAGCVVHYMQPYPSADDVAELCGRVQADAILTRQGPVTAAAMDASARLRIVARHGVGVDDVDLAAAAARGLLVTRAPGSNTQAVAEHTLALILALAKDLRRLPAAIAGGGWRGGATKVRDIAGLRLGLLGFGAIGQAVAAVARPFAMAVTAFDPVADDAAFAGVARAATLEDMLAVTDVLSVHCPYSPATRHIIDAAALAAMPAGSFVINTARGGIVDEVALEAALESGHIAGAGLDVFETEPPGPAHPLRRHPKVIVTPHVAGVTDGSLVNMGVMAAECIAARLTGGVVPPECVVETTPAQVAPGT